MSRVVLFANTDWYLWNFRRNLATSLREEGLEVVLVSPMGPYVCRLKQEFEWREADLGGGSKGVKNIRAIQNVAKIYRELKPSLVHHFTIKCVLFGGWAARKHKIPAVHAVTGLGHVFTDDRLQNRMARPFIRAAYRNVFKSNCRVIFQNSENQDFFVNQGLVSREKVRLIRGSGADCERFQPSRLPRRPGPIRFLFASRLLNEKGIRELLAAFQLVCERGVRAELVVAGEPYPGNPSSISEEELRKLKLQAAYLGHVDDMLPVFLDSDVVVLPSYAEGTPRVLLEASACGKPLISTNIAGCKDLVVPGENGLMVPPKSITELADAMVFLASRPSERIAMGKRSRFIAESRFSESFVIAKTIEIYRELLEAQPSA